MIVDTSAIVAMLQLEPEATAMLRVLSKSSDSSMSAATYLECGIVIDRAKDPKASDEEGLRDREGYCATVDPLISSISILTIPLDPTFITSYVSP